MSALEYCCLRFSKCVIKTDSKMPYVPNMKNNSIILVITFIPYLFGRTENKIFSAFIL